MGRIKINARLLPVKAHYFLFNGGTAAWMPFIPVFAGQLGISEVGVGAMYAVLPFAGLVCRPILGAIADKFQIHRAVFILTILFMSLCFAGTGLIPPLPHEQKGHFHCTPVSSYLTVNVSDQCLLDQLEKSNSLMRCDMDFFHLGVVSPEDCNTWGLNPDQCSNVIGMSAVFNLTHIEQLNGTSYFKADELVVESNHVQPRCQNRTEMHCDINCNNTLLMTKVRKPVPVESAYRTDQFIALFSLTLIAWANFAVSVSFSDSMTFAVLGAEHESYGAQRLWGAVGWGVMMVVTGWIVDLASSGLTYTNYTPCFVILAVLMGFDILAASRIKATIPPATNAAFSEALSILITPSMVLFLLSIILVGMCTGFLWQFLFWYIEDLLRARGCGSASSAKLLEGLVGGVQCLLGELPFFFISGWIIKKIGHAHSMTLVLLGMGARLILYSVITNPWYFLPVELLQGLTIGLFWATMASYAYVVAPSGVAATMQGIVGATFEGIGTALGSFVGGLMYNTYGGEVTYRIFGIAAIVGAVVHFILTFVIAKTCPSGPSANRLDMEKVEDMSSEESFSQVQYRPPKDAVKLSDISPDS